MTVSPVTTSEVVENTGVELTPSLSARFFNPSNLSRIYRLLHSLTRRLLAVSWCRVGVSFDFYGQGNSAKLPKQGQRVIWRR